MLRGEVAALTAAFLWALSTVIFGQLGKSISPLVLNLAKGAIAIALIILTLVIQQNLQPQLPPARDLLADAEWRRRHWLGRYGLFQID
jgi:drug/metabolite transporter (DMT)-like permease